MTPIDVLCSNFVMADGKSVKSCAAYLTKKEKISLGSLRIVPKICQGQPQQCAHSSAPDFSGIIAERVNTAKTRHK